MALKLLSKKGLLFRAGLKKGRSEQLSRKGSGPMSLTWRCGGSGMKSHFDCME